MQADEGPARVSLGFTRATGQVLRASSAIRLARRLELMIKSCCTLILALGLAARAEAQAWFPDLGNGRYRNPVIFADYSDPDVIRVGDDFYLTASSFNAVPALPILHSRDLVN